MKIKSAFAMRGRTAVFALALSLFAVTGQGSALAFKYFSYKGPKAPPVCRVPSMAGTYAEIRPRILRMGFKPVLPHPAECDAAAAAVPDYKDCKAYPEWQGCGADNPYCEFLFRDDKKREFQLTTESEVPIPDKIFYRWEMDCDAKPILPKPPAIRAHTVKPTPSSVALPKFPPAGNN